MKRRTKRKQSKAIDRRLFAPTIWIPAEMTDEQVIRELEEFASEYVRDQEPGRSWSNVAEFEIANHLRQRGLPHKPTGRHVIDDLYGPLWRKSKQLPSPHGELP